MPSLTSGKMEVPPRKVIGGTVPDGLVYLEDNTDDDVPGWGGWWVLLRESDNEAMILFTGCRKEIAEGFKARIEAAVQKWHETRGGEE